MLKHWSSPCRTVHHEVDEESERADRQADGCETNECSDEEEMRTEMMEQSEDQCWNTPLSGGHVIRHRSGTGTTQGTESSHWWLQTLLLQMLLFLLHAASLSPHVLVTCLISVHVCSCTVMSSHLVFQIRPWVRLKHWVKRTWRQEMVKQPGKTCNSLWFVSQQGRSLI